MLERHCGCSAASAWPRAASRRRLAAPAARWAASVAGRAPPAGLHACSRAFAPFQHLLRQLAVGLRRGACRVVLEDGAALHGRLRIAHGLADPGAVDELTEVLLEDLDRLARVQRATVEHRRDDPLDPDVRVQVLSHHRERVLQLHETTERKVLALHGDDDAGRRDKGVDRQQPQRRRRVDEDVVVAAAHLDERLLERALAADEGAERELGAGEVDRATARSTSRRSITSEIGTLWTSTSNIDRSITSGLSPWLIVRLPWGSRSISSTRLPISLSATPRLSVVVVFATPPFWLARTMHARRRRLRAGRGERGQRRRRLGHGRDGLVRLGDGLAHRDRLRDDLEPVGLGGVLPGRRCRCRRGARAQSDETHDHASFTTVHPSPSTALNPLHPSSRARPDGR